MSFYKKKKEYKLTWTAGDTEYLQIRYLQSDKVTPVDFTDATLTMQLRKSQSSVDPSLAINGTVDEETGIITFTASPAETRALSSSLQNKYYFDAQFSNPSKTKTLLRGRILVESDITR